MNILHFSLGFPPYRTGGLTKFCIDLMNEQIAEGNEVSLLWPGRITSFTKKERIRRRKSVNCINSYEIINPVPVPFDEGIKDFRAYEVNGDEGVYENFLNKLRPDVIHIHTLMGLHKALIVVAKRRGIRIVFTAHDFFPICPKVTMFRHGKICKSVKSCEECGQCNSTALSLWKIYLLQTPIYRCLKNIKLVKNLRKKHRNEFLDNNSFESELVVGTKDDYKSLRNHYFSILKMMDVVHYNSSVTKQVFDDFIQISDSVLIPISHAGISDKRYERTYGNKLRVRYLGPRAQGKGFDILESAVKRLWSDGKDICLDVHFYFENSTNYINCHESFTSSELEKIFDDTDILVCPSIWYETFGYTVLEALSHGVPVIVSGTVGAKDIIAKGSGYVIDDIDENKLYDVLNSLTPNILMNMNKSIIENQHIITIAEMSYEINKKVYNSR